jgi:TRAP-type C4-dicarboxylate transport system permease small subunit
MVAWVPRLFGAAAGLALFAMMLLTFADVFSRKFLGNSITGAVEVTELAMLVMIFCALPLASLAGEHIAFDLLDRVLPAALLRWQQVASHLLTAAVFGGAAWVVWLRALRTADMGDTTATLVIRLAPYQQLVAVMLLATAVVHALLAWRQAHASALAPAVAAEAPDNAPANIHNNTPPKR